MLTSTPQQRSAVVAIRTWTGRGFWAVTDQALFAGANFLVSILLARWLEPAEYGAFSLAYAVFLLLGTLHTGLWTEPMLVYGSGRFRESFTSYQRVLLRCHWRFAGAASLIFLLLALGLWAFGARELALSFLGLTLAAPTVLYLWIVRRGAYVLLNPRLAALGGGLYLLLYLGLTFLFLRTNTLGTFTALLAMAAAGFVSAEIIRWRLDKETEQIVNSEEVQKLHWRYGRWALLAGVFSWVPGNIFYLILPVFHGLEAAAHFKALMNLLMPILHINGALGQLLVPGMVRALAHGKLVPFALANLAVLSTLATLYWLLLIALGPQIMEWMYEGKYFHDAGWFLWLGLMPVLAAMVVVMSSVLRAVERPDVVARAYAFMAVFSNTVGFFLILYKGLDGCFLAYFFTYIFMVIIFHAYLIKLYSNKYFKISR
ncbi:MAG: lipopolysaccharide biosynthesis protein [Desulfomicrobium sp.]